MSSLQSLREFISERLAAAAEEIFRHCEGTIVQYEQELCRQRRLLEIWKPQLQPASIDHEFSSSTPIYISPDLPKHYVNEKLDLCNQQRNSRVEQGKPPQIEEQQKEPDLVKTKEQEKHEPSNIKEELKEPEPPQIEKEHRNPETPQIKEEQMEPEPPQIKEEQEEQEGLCISQDEDQFYLKEETDFLMEIPTYEENEHSKAHLNSQHSFYVTDRQHEEGSPCEELESTTDGETDIHNRNFKKRRDKSSVQNVDSSHLSESQCDSDVGKKPKKVTLVRKCEQSSEENRVSSEKSVKIAHIMSHHTRDISDKERYVCEECGESFRWWTHLKTHMRTHTGELFSCTECDKSFCAKSYLERHMRSHTGEKLFSCKECDKGFGQISHLKRHMRTHTGEKPFACLECDKSYGDASTLKYHMTTHTGEKPFSCKECDACFSRISGLKIHMRTHTGEKPFSCKECDRSFSHVFSLKIHMRTHTGERPFSCKECDKSFSQLSTLKNHIRTHTGEKPFSCNECDSSFSQKSNLKTHMRTHTGEKPVSFQEFHKGFSESC